MSVPNKRNLRVCRSPYKARRFALHFIDNFWRHRLMRIFTFNLCKNPVQHLDVWWDNFNV